jgi:D-methionine transport system substrate-binding protein
MAFKIRLQIFVVLALALAACRRPAEDSVVVGVLGGPEQEVLDFVRARNPNLKLRVVRYEDPQRLRAAVKAREIAAASFETHVALNQTNPDPELGSAGPMLTLPLGFYSRRVKALDGVVVGSVVAISADAEAQTRALLVLANSGLITVPEVERPLRPADVLGNPHRLELRVLPSTELPRALEEGSLVALDYASAARLGLAPARHAILREDGFTPFAQVLTARRADLDTSPAWLTSLLAAYRTPAVKTFILEHFEDSVRRPW